MEVSYYAELAILGGYAPDEITEMFGVTPLLGLARGECFPRHGVADSPEAAKGRPAKSNIWIFRTPETHEGAAHAITTLMSTFRPETVAQCGMHGGGKTRVQLVCGYSLDRSDPSDFVKEAFAIDKQALAWLAASGADLEVYVAE